MSTSIAETMRWLDYEVRVHTVPANLHPEEEPCYRFLFESKLAWRVDHFDPDGRIWIALHHVDDASGSDWYETLRLEDDSFRRIPCDPPYPVSS